ncbi:alanine dehydrogenase [Mesoplasma seiffertii]|uniref:alanine dehydrogenase n=1 Tax=Mesoplasma seiffertii TaxID=28224 RepID=UPI00047D5646|nr:alanine dehydrogenase [Mesoplasma seiffertii]
MIIGIPKEIKNNENRVAIVPAGVRTLVQGGHTVFVQTEAGLGSGITDAEYAEAGAEIVSLAKVWDAQMIMKVKEPLEQEFKYIKKDQIIFTYLHLAANKKLTEFLKKSGAIGVAYETMVGPKNDLPLLTPMSEVAGRMSIQIGAHFLEKNNGGSGVLLGGVPGVAPGKVTVIGGGIVGYSAAKTAVGLGAEVTLLDINPNRLRELDNIFNGRVKLLISNSTNISEAVASADLVVGAVLIPGDVAPKIVKETDIKKMRPGSVVIDIPIDQGGIFETSEKITSHENPIFIKHNVIHYTVPNMPGAVAKSSTFALTNSTIPYALEIANKGIIAAALENKTIKTGINIFKNAITFEAVAKAFNEDFIDFMSLI